VELQPVAKQTQAQVQELAQAQAELTSTLADLPQTMTQTAAKIRALEQQSASLTAQNQLLQQNVSNLNQANSVLHRHLSQQQTQVVTSAEHERLKQHLRALEQTNEQLALEVATIKQENWRLEQTTPQPVVVTGVGESETEELYLPPLPENDLASALVAPTPPDVDLVSAAPPVETSPETFKHQQLSALGIKVTRLSPYFPLFSRRGEWIDWLGLQAELTRVLGGTLFALEQIKRRGSQ
jgi:ABC-type transporter Mla subunit MlaD